MPAPDIHARIYESLFRNSPDLLLLIEPDGTLADLSDIARHVFGKPRKELIGKNISELAAPKDATALLKLFRKQGPASKSAKEFIWNFKHGRGHAKQLRVRESIVATGGKLFALAVLRDMTPQLENSEKLVRKNAQLQQLNQLLVSLAKHDQLTGIFNRRHFEEILDNELARAIRYRGDLSVGMVDIDDFKKINDTYGHPAGDRVLKTIAQAMQNGVRRTDIVARYGGEEFVMILPHTPAEGAFEVAEKLRHKIEETEIKIGQTLLHVTISIGIASNVGKAPQREKLMANADAALYDAKHAGKNRTLVHQSIGDTAD